MTSRPRRLFLAGLVAALVGSLLPAMVAAPADATVMTLCTGYAGCANAGMPASGYASASSTSYWRMYTGHNCTNYAAYRMVRSGLPNVRPWSGGGNATYWGTSMASITNSTPAVGAVAWWKAYASPAGSAGHVAYVERVVSADEIIVSQDSWGGDFSWARITRTGSGWPTGFIHFNDVPLTNLSAPAVTGTAKVGSTLRVSPGTWNPSATLGYQWRANGTKIAGATAPTYVPTPAQEDQRLTVRVTASKLGYPTTSVVTEPTTAVLPGVLSNTTVPTITGEARVDSTLTVDTGQWKPAPDRLSIQWAADGVPIEGADGDTLVLGPELVGKSVTATVTADKAGYSSVAATSAATEPVAPGVLTVTSEPAVTGVPRLGQTLTLSEVGVTPSATSRIEWLRGGAPVPGANGSTYTLTKADLGWRIAARVTLTRPGYTTVVLRTAGTPRVKTIPTIRETVRANTGRLVLDATVRATGANPVSGVLRLRSGGHVLEEVAVRDGAATIRVPTLRPGRRVFRLVFLATRAVARGELERTITIR